MLRKILITSLITVGLSGVVNARINGYHPITNPNFHAGYGGSAQFNSGQGVTATGTTMSECQQMLDSAIAYRVNNWGWTVTQYTPCQYRG